MVGTYRSVALGTAAVLFAVLCACSMPATPPAAEGSTGDDAAATADSTAGDQTTATTTPAASGGTTQATGDANDGTVQRSLSVVMRADYTASVLSASTARGAPASGTPARLPGCPDTPPANDFPGLPAGDDCDGDGAAVQYVTPSVFRVAVKRLALIDTAGQAVELVPDSGLLRDAQVIDLTSSVQLDAATLSAKRFVQLKVEFYYYELVMPMNIPPADQSLRLYLSDDDFAAEGNAGHHQGDITLLDSSGAELGFVVEGAPWTDAALSPQHQDMVYAGSSDPETGHRRGPFGDTDLWDSTEFRQGATQDVYRAALDLDLDLTAVDATLTVVFNVAESWFYEDYDDDGYFAPCGHGQGNPGDACFDGGAWAAIFPTPELQVALAAEDEGQGQPTPSAGESAPRPTQLKSLRVRR